MYGLITLSTLVIIMGSIFVSIIWNSVAAMKFAWVMSILLTWLIIRCFKEEP